MSEKAVSVFLSYSRSDLEMLKKLNKQLASLVRTQKIKTWHDRDIEAGSEWEKEIQDRLNTADIIILLISADFIDSDYCYGNELKRAIERHDAGEARVIPVILKPCLWNLREIPFSKLNVLPDHAYPITKWEDPEEAYAAVAQHISNLVENLRQSKIEQETERQRQAEEQERLRQAEQLKQQQAVEAERLKQQAELERKRQQEQAQQPLPDVLRGNYTQLEALLEAERWREADQETTKQMCQVMGRQSDGWLRVEDIEQFPCADLRAIDQLWVKHSNGKFGFSVQRKIWQQCGSPTDYNQQWEQFGETVGWRSKGVWKSYSEVTFDTSAPDGHLPLSPLCPRGWVVFGGFESSSLARRCVNCSI